MSQIMSRSNSYALLVCLIHSTIIVLYTNSHEKTLLALLNSHNLSSFKCNVGITLSIWNSTWPKTLREFGILSLNNSHNIATKKKNGIFDS